MIFLDSGEAVVPLALPLRDDNLVEDDKVYVLTLEAVPGKLVVLVQPYQASLAVEDDDSQSDMQVHDLNPDLHTLLMKRE